MNKTTKKKSKYTNLVIDRKRWRRGGKYEDVALLDDKGQMCCLGFLAKQCGIKLYRGEQCDYDSLDSEDIEKLPYGFIDAPQCPTKLHNDLIDTNDDKSLRGKEREEKIKQLMLKANVKVTFK